MPNRPNRRCTTPGCPLLSLTGRCPACRDTKRKLHRARQRVSNDYGPAWPARRLDFLTHHPRCEICRRAANVPDHHPQSRRQLLAAGVSDPDADVFLRPLCSTCHNRETARNQPGGWHRDRGN